LSIIRPFATAQGGSQEKRDSTLGNSQSRTWGEGKPKKHSKGGKEMQKALKTMGGTGTRPKGMWEKVEDDN